MMMGAMMAMAGENNFRETNRYDPKQKPELKKVVPKGCKEYWFTKSGRFYNSFSGDAIIFYCLATNDKNAFRKFNSWIKLNLNHCL